MFTWRIRTEFFLQMKKTPVSTPDHVAVDPLPQFCRAKPLAKSLGLSSRTLYRYAQAGHFGRFRISSRTTLFDVAEVSAFVRTGRIKNDPVA